LHFAIYFIAACRVLSGGKNPFSKKFEIIRIDFQFAGGIPVAE
jgi:hypothetical protein